ncbi:SAM and SH3 domain-containing protein 1 isoform X4 [Octopus sinensis]|uniref:Sterile alpha motif domain-containing protein 5 n=1 Tax=Octopus sinensis TaxID=2607531 RepID=A0A6P7U839_9MOLL|nr:SAM and SH3 domain-containing protein 1 isoform X4 [Octopus sinensis]
MADWNIVTDWLRSLNLVHYTQAFLDNGYDDLEICKQIGDPDLDAIGVFKQEHRQRILDAVRILREQGGTAVYFTLEKPNNDIGVAASIVDGHGHVACTTTANNTDSTYHRTGGLVCLGGGSGSGIGGGNNGDHSGDCSTNEPIHSSRRLPNDYEDGKSALLTYPKIQLKHIIRDKLVRDEIDLSGPPYTTAEIKDVSQKDQSCTRSSLMALAVKYAGELNTHVEDVFDRLDELRWWKITKDSDSLSVWRLKLSKSLSPVRNVQSPTLYGYMPRGTPPPLPACPPPSSSHQERCAELEKHLKGVHLRMDNQSGNYCANYISLDGEKDMVESKKKTTALGKLFRNMGLRKSGRNKFSYKQHQGDPNAYEITMNDDDRIALMVMVKEGKITTEHALEVVKRFEDHRRLTGEGDEQINDQIYGSRESPLLTQASIQTRGRRQHRPEITKPTKSSSDLYSGSSPRCEICRSQSQDVDDRMRWPDNRGSSDYQCTEHRRVHSIGHMEFHQSQSPEFMRSISCSPTRGGSSHTDSTKSTSVGGSPSHSRLYSPVLYLTGGNKASDEQLLISLSPAAEGKDDDALKKNSSGVSKSASGTSLDSDLSAGCPSHGPLPNEIAATRNGDIANCSNSTMSASSETSPAGGRKPESLPARMRNFARSNSYSTGDDGMSSDYDDHDETNMRLSQSCPRGMITQRSLSVNDRSKDLRNDLKKKLLRSKEPNYRSRQMNQDVSDVHGVIGSPEIFNRCKYQVTNSQNSIASTVDGMPLYSGPFLGQARVHTDYDPEPQEKDALVLRKGDIIQVMSMIQPGIWKGMLRQKVGNFRFSHVEMISDDTPRGQRKERIHRRRNSQRSKPRNVEELMQRIGLEHLTSIFLLNGYDKLETFVDIDEDDLSELNIRDTEQRAKLLTAAELLVDCNSPDILDVPAKCDGNTPADTPSSLSPPTLFNTEPPPPMPIQPMSRDSGFYASSDNSLHKGQQSARPSDEDIHKKKMLGQSATDNSISETDVTNKDESQPQKSIACQTAGQTEPSTNYEISDLELSAEDREVCEITDGFAQKEIRASPKKATPLTRVQRCSSAQQSAQESIANGYISHSSSFCNMTAECSHVSPMLHHLSKKHEQHGPINVAIVDSKTPIRSCGSEGSDGTQSDLSDISPHRNSKPVSLRKSASKLCSAKTNGSLVMMDRVVSPSYHIILSDSLSSSPMVKRDVSTQMDPFRKKGNSVNENHLRTQKLIYGSKPPMFLEGDNIPNQIYFPGTLGRTIEGSYYGSKDSPNRTIPRPPKPPSRSLIPLVKAKLSDEKIDLSLEPYSDKNGYCGIPPLLVQRYAEELRHDVWGIAAVMEQVRISQLLSYGREGMTSESLAKACLSSCDLKISSLRDFLISIGLPMYGEHLIKMGFSSMERLLSMTDNDVQRVVHDTRHIKRLMHALEWVRSRLASPTRKTKIASVKDQV